MVEKEKRNNKILVSGIAVFIIGIWILIAPGQVLRLMGIATLLQGGVMMYRYYKLEEKTGFRAKGLLFIGVVLAVMGCLFVFHVEFVVALFAYLIAILFFIDAIQNIKLAFSIRKENPQAFLAALVLNALVLAAAVILVINPLILGMTVAVIVGVTLIFIGIEYMYIGYKKIK